MQDTDHLGRPVVVVTGTGIVTSLGQGKDANWAALTSGKSGIHRITRFPVTGMKTTMAGTIDFVDVPELSAPALSERLAELVIEEAIAGRKRITYAFRFKYAASIVLNSFPWFGMRR